MGLFAAPLNSSHQFVDHVMDPVAAVVPHCAPADFGREEIRTLIAIRSAKVRVFVAGTWKITNSPPLKTAKVTIRF
jgi:hypothetical protein